jgi:protoporphyrinogen oxidase
MLIGASGFFLGGLTACSDDGEEAEPRLPTGEDKGDDYEICHAMRNGETWNLPVASGDLYDCVIIGAGISGLVAAWRLEKLGSTNVLLLEKDELGGMARQDGDPAHPFSQAAAYTVYPYNANLTELYQDLGIVTGLNQDGQPIVDEKYLVNAPVNNVNIGGKWYEDGWESGLASLPYSPKIIADLQAFRADMKAWYEYVGQDNKFAFDTPTDASTTDPAVRALDEMTLLEYVTSKSWDRAVSEFFDRYIRSALGTTHDEVSAWAAIGFLGAEFHPTLSQPGGNAYLSKALAEKVGADKIKTSATVVRAKIEGMEVHVSYIEARAVRTVRAKTAIYAAPRYVAKYMLPDLVAAGRDEAKDFHYTPYIVAQVHVNKTPAGLAYDNWVYGDYVFTDVIVADWAGLGEPRSAPLARPNVLTVYTPLFGPNARVELLTKSFEDYEKMILDDLERVIPGVRATVTQFDLYRWGHAMLAAEKGFIFGKSRVDSQKPVGLIRFACHDVDGLPAFENAVGAAYRAAAEVAAVLGI